MEMNARVFRAWTMELVGKKLEDINATAPMALMEVSVKWVSEVEQDLWQDPYMNTDNNNNSKQWKKSGMKEQTSFCLQIPQTCPCTGTFLEVTFGTPIFGFSTLSYDKAPYKSRDKLA